MNDELSWRPIVDKTEAIDVRSAGRAPGILCAEMWARDCRALPRASILACGQPTSASLRMDYVDEIEQLRKSKGQRRISPLVITFGPDWCSASLRTAVQLGRNPHLSTNGRASSAMRAAGRLTESSLALLFPVPSP